MVRVFMYNGFKGAHRGRSVGARGDGAKDVA